MIRYRKIARGEREEFKYPEHLLLQFEGKYVNIHVSRR